MNHGGHGGHGDKIQRRQEVRGQTACPPGLVPGSIVAPCHPSVFSVRLSLSPPWFKTLLFPAAYARGQGCLAGPYPFPSDHTRVLYFHSDNRPPDARAHEEFRADVVLMSGPPG